MIFHLHRGNTHTPSCVSCSQKIDWIKLPLNIQIFLFYVSLKSRNILTVLGSNVYRARKTFTCPKIQKEISINQRIFLLDRVEVDRVWIPGFFLMFIFFLFPCSIKLYESLHDFHFFQTLEGKNSENCANANYFLLKCNM